MTAVKVMLAEMPLHNEQIIVSTEATVYVAKDAAKILLRENECASFPLVELHMVLRGESFTYQYHAPMGAWLAWPTERT